jgi:putative hemolysin
MVPRLSERTALEVMIDVGNISFLHDEMSLSEALNVSARDFHTRYPVRAVDDKEHILGYVNIKEVVNMERIRKDDAKLTELIRPIAFAEPDDTAAELLEKFAAQHCHMTIVKDPDTREIRGLVTLEDIVEELIGDLDDEFDPLPRTFYSPQDNFWIVGGGIPLTQLARDTGLDLPRRVEPASAWFGRMLKRNPRVGDIFCFRNAEFYVRKVRRSMVWEFNLKRCDAVESEYDNIEENDPASESETA